MNAAVTAQEAPRAGQAQATQGLVCREVCARTPVRAGRCGNKGLCSTGNSVTPMRGFASFRVHNP